MSLPWMNTKINEVMRDRDYHHRKAIRSYQPYQPRRSFITFLNSSFHWAQYRRLRNLANREIKSAKSNYYCEVIKEGKGDSSKIWKAVNEASCRNNKSSTPQCIIVDEVHHKTPRSIASVLNSHFATIRKILADKIPSVNRVSLSNNKHSESFEIKEVSEVEVLEQLLSLNLTRQLN